MRFLRGILFLLRRLLLALAVGWIDGLRSLWLLLLAFLRRLRLRRKEDERQRRMAEERCVPVRHPALQRPDPLIYSQSFLMSLGLAVTWDNPDIELSRNGVPVPSSALDPATEYDLTARIWNGSTEAPVVGLPVRFTAHGFGIGASGGAIGQTVVDLGVKGGPHTPAFASVKWTTPPTPGHYCLRAHIDWFDDATPNNNVGQENTNVVEAHSPAQTTFLLRNDDPERRRRYRFEADAYALPELPPCDERKPKDDHGRGPHKRERHPLPPGWQIVLQPSEAVLAPAEEIAVAVVVTPPDGFLGRQAVNVNAFDEAGLAGGVTFYVEAS
jgi:hypothetical protein